jgi:hypothetical protein
MTRIKLDYVLEYIDRHDKVRRYFRRKGFKQIAPPGVPGSDEFMASYQRALAQAGSLNVGASCFNPKDGRTDYALSQERCIHESTGARNSVDASKHPRSFPHQAKPLKSKGWREEVATPAGFEPATLSLEG